MSQAIPHGSMTLPELALILAELQDLVGMPVQRIVQPDRFTVVLQLMRARLLFGVRPGFCRIHRLEAGPKAPPEPPAFCMLLRKFLGGALVQELRLDPGDRVIHLVTRRATLVARLMDRHAALVLLDAGQAVLGSLTPSGKGPALGEGLVPVPLPPAPGASPAPVRFSTSLQAERLFGDALKDDDRRQLARQVTRELGRARRRVTHVEQDLLRCEEAGDLRRRADLLMAHPERLRDRGLGSVVVADLFSDGQPVEVPLDPSLSVLDNAQKLYHRSRRLDAGVEHAFRRLQQAEDRVAGLEGLQEALAVGAPEDLTELERRARDLMGRPRRPSRAAGPRSTAGGRRREPYRTFRSLDGGHVILVGRSSRDNHQLTFQVARGRDIWLHTRDLPGCHGIIRMADDSDLTGSALLDAATLVAHFSKVQPGDRVDVSYTRRKNVRPAPGAPGRVYLSEAQSLHIALDPERITRLYRLAERESEDS